MYLNEITISAGYGVNNLYAWLKSFNLRLAQHLTPQMLIESPFIKIAIALYNQDFMNGSAHTVRYVLDVNEVGDAKTVLEVRLPLPSHFARFEEEIEPKKIINFIMLSLRQLDQIPLTTLDALEALFSRALEN